MTTIQQGRTELELPCTLTDEEVQSRGRMPGETVVTIDDVQDARTAAMKEFKDRLVGLNEQQRKLARIIRDRVEPRMVQCLVQFHMPREGMKRIVRGDTGEIVRELEMTAAEKLLNLFASQKEFEDFLKAQGLSGARDAEPPAEKQEDEKPQGDDGQEC